MREIKFRVEHNGETLLIYTATEPLGGRGAHNWKGGIEMNSGYVYRRVFNHPNSNSRGYCAEHRLVMEESIGRLLSKDEVVHHIDGDRKNNDIHNLKLVVNQSEHAGMEFVGRRNPNGTRISKDPMLEAIRIRLYDKDRGITRVFSLSKLISTTYRRGCFEFRGRFTGLKDKNGEEIYEGDILDDGRKVEFPEDWEWLDMCHEEMEIVGNIYEHSHLLNK